MKEIFSLLKRKKGKEKGILSEDIINSGIKTKYSMFPAAKSRKNTATPLDKR